MGRIRKFAESYFPLSKFIINILMTDLLYEGKGIIASKDFRCIDKDYFLSEIYKDIGIKVIYMTPKEFKQSYKGKYSQYFSRIKDSHNRYLSVNSVSKLLKLLKKMNYYGVIYKISQIKDISGNRIDDASILVLKRKSKRMVMFE